MKNSILGPFALLVLAAVAPSSADAAPYIRLARPPTFAPLSRPLAFDTEVVALDTATIQSFRSGATSPTRTDAAGQTVTAELRAPLGLTTGALFLRPFISAGGGLGTSNIVDRTGVHSSDGLLWTTKLGVYLQTSARMVWQFSYRHVETPDFDAKRSVSASHVSPGADVIGGELSFVLGR